MPTCRIAVGRSSAIARAAASAASTGPDAADDGPDRRAVHECRLEVGGGDDQEHGRTVSLYQVPREVPGTCLAALALAGCGGSSHTLAGNGAPSLATTCGTAGLSASTYFLRTR